MDTARNSINEAWKFHRTRPPCHVALFVGRSNDDCNISIFALILSQLMV